MIGVAINLQVWALAVVWRLCRELRPKLCPKLVHLEFQVGQLARTRLEAIPASHPEWTLVWDKIRDKVWGRSLGTKFGDKVQRVECATSSGGADKLSHYAPSETVGCSHPIWWPIPCFSGIRHPKRLRRKPKRRRRFALPAHSTTSHRCFRPRVSDFQAFAYAAGAATRCHRWHCVVLPGVSLATAVTETAWPAGTSTLAS